MFRSDSGCDFPLQHRANRTGFACRKPANTAIEPTGRESRDVSVSSELADLLLGAGDLLEIRVFGAPELSATTRVSGAGEITLPLAGTIKVAASRWKQLKSR